MSNPKPLIVRLGEAQATIEQLAKRNAAMISMLKTCQEFVRQVSYDEHHGCCTGDCPHDHGNQCATALTKLLEERAAEAKALLGTE